MLIQKKNKPIIVCEKNSQFNRFKNPKYTQLITVNVNQLNLEFLSKAQNQRE